MNEEREKIEIGDEVMFRGIKEHYNAPFNTPEVGERGIVVSNALLKSGLTGYRVKWYAFGYANVHESIMSITRKNVALPFKVDETVITKKDLRVAPIGTFGKVIAINERFYGVVFENGKMWYCSEKEIAKPTKSETALHDEIIRLRGLFKCQK